MGDGSSQVDSGCSLQGSSPLSLLGAQPSHVRWTNRATLAFRGSPTLQKANADPQTVSDHSDFQATWKLVPSDVRAEGRASSEPLLLTMMISCTSLPNALITPDVEVSVAKFVSLTSV